MYADVRGQTAWFVIEVRRYTGLRRWRTPVLPRAENRPLRPSSLPATVEGAQLGGAV